MLNLFGHSAQFRQQLEQSWQKLYRVAYAWTHDQHLASDLAQETISRALKFRNKFDDARALEIWLFKVMVNCWRDTFRRRRDTENIDDIEIVDTQARPEEHLEQLAIVRRVRDAIAHLNFDQRQVITLVVLEGLAYEEAASVLDIPVGTVMSRISRARTQLKKLLQDLHAGDDSHRLWRIK